MTKALWYLAIGGSAVAAVVMLLANDMRYWMPLAVGGVAALAAVFAHIAYGSVKRERDELEEQQRDLREW